MSPDAPLGLYDDASAEWPELPTAFPSPVEAAPFRSARAAERVVPLPPDRVYGPRRLRLRVAARRTLDGFTATCSHEVWTGVRWKQQSRSHLDDGAPDPTRPVLPDAQAAADLLDAHAEPLAARVVEHYEENERQAAAEAKAAATMVTVRMVGGAFDGHEFERVALGCPQQLVLGAPPWRPLPDRPDAVHLAPGHEFDADAESFDEALYAFGGSVEEGGRFVFRYRQRWHHRSHRSSGTEEDGERCSSYGAHGAPTCHRHES